MPVKRDGEMEPYHNLMAAVIKRAMIDGLSIKECKKRVKNIKKNGKQYALGNNYVEKYANNKLREAKEGRAFIMSERLEGLINEYFLPLDAGYLREKYLKLEKKGLTINEED